MVAISIKVTGLAEAVALTAKIAAAGAACAGPIASFTSASPYARFIETGHSSKPQTRRAGPAQMFQRGVAETVTAVPAILDAAILNGPGAVAGAKRVIQVRGVASIRSFTPVVSGALRTSVTASGRP